MAPSTAVGKWNGRAGVAVAASSGYTTHIGAILSLFEFDRRGGREGSKGSDEEKSELHDGSIDLMILETLGY